MVSQSCILWRILLTIVFYSHLPLWFSSPFLEWKISSSLVRFWISIPIHRSNLRNCICMKFCFELRFFISWEIAEEVLLFPFWTHVRIHKWMKIDYAQCWMTTFTSHFAGRYSDSIKAILVCVFLKMMSGMRNASLITDLHMWHDLCSKAQYSLVLFHVLLPYVHWLNKNLPKQITAIRGFYHSKLSLCKGRFAHGWGVLLLFHFC